MFTSRITTCFFLFLFSLNGLSAQSKFCYEGAVIKAPGGETSLVFELEDLGETRILRFSTRPLISPYQYLLTDADNTIVSISASNSIDIAGLAAGNYRIWAFSYIGDIIATVGQNAAETQLAAFCSGLSKNFVSLQINGGDDDDNGDGGDGGDNGDGGGDGGTGGSGNGAAPDTSITITFNTVLEAITRNSLLQILERGVENADLEVALMAEGPLTVFAPVNNAFAALDPDQLVALFDAPSTALRTTILHHVVAGSFSAADLFDGQLLTTLGGETLSVQVTTEGIFIGGSKVIQADVVASNGIVHLIMNIVESIAP